MPERGVTPGSLLIDRFLPRYDLSVVHASVLPARPEDCYRAARQLDLLRDPIIRTLLGLRSLPNRLADRLGRRERAAATAADRQRTFRLDDLVRYGWVLLDEQPTETLVDDAVNTALRGRTAAVELRVDW